MGLYRYGILIGISGITNTCQFGNLPDHLLHGFCWTSLITLWKSVVQDYLGILARQVNTLFDEFPACAFKY